MKANKLLEQIEEELHTQNLEYLEKYMENWIEMDMNKYKTIEFLRAEIVSESSEKVAVVVSDGEETDGKFGKQVVFKVRFCNKKYNYSPNGQTVENLINAYGADSSDWIGKPIVFEVEEQKGKPILIGKPPKVSEEQVEWISTK